MTRAMRLTRWSTSLLLCLLPLPTPAQARPRPVTVTINGQTGQALIVRMNGKSFLDIEALARIAKGSVGFPSSGIILILPASAPEVLPPSPSDTPDAGALSPAETSTTEGFSKDFLRAGIDQISVIREWRVALRNAVQTNNPVTEDWTSTFRRNTDSKLALASAAVTTAADREALPLLQNQFANIQRLSNRFVNLHDSVTFTPTSAFDDDPLDQQILACSRGLNALLSSRQFQDVAACH